MKNTAILLIDCPDRKGLVAAVAEFLYRRNANILHTDQHQDNEQGLFLMRVEWDLEGFTLSIEEFRRQFARIADQFQMRWRLELSTLRPKVAIFVSHYDHCIVDLLYRQQSGELLCDIPLIISNHSTAARIAEFHQVPFHLMPVTSDNKAEVEEEQLQLLKDNAIDLIVLAR